VKSFYDEECNTSYLAVYEGVSKNVKRLPEEKKLKMMMTGDMENAMTTK